MGKLLRTLIGWLGIVLISAPLSIVTTILLLPLWSWIEASTGVESVGHSGPAPWCYAAVFLVFIAGAALAFFARRRTNAS